MRRVERFIRNLAVVGLAIAAVTGCDDTSVREARIDPAPPPSRLVIVTPHNETIRRTFYEGFSEYYDQTHDQPVAIQWIHRGSPQCVECIEDAATNSEIALRGLAPDLMFGGGVTEHQRLVEMGLARPMKAKAPEEALLPKTLLGVPLLDEQNYWHATALSGFGIFVNRRACIEREIAAPRTWADLADPAYYGWVAMADPARSGSNRFCLGLILQRHGWDEGWSLILRTAANCRALFPSSSEAITAVSSGLCLSGYSVNFVALQEAQRHDAGRLDYVSPADASAITPDLITVAKYASVPDLAEEFVRYCLSEEGQALWSLRGGRPGAEEGASQRTLFRYPVLPTMYEKYADKLAVGDNPFERTSDFAVDMELERKQAAIVVPLLAAACGDNHILLQRAWKAVIDRGLPEDAVAELTKPLFTEAEALELGARYQRGEEAGELDAQWAASFREKYEKVLAMLGTS